MTTYNNRRQEGGNLLSRTECNALRGLAIAGIVLHNYCHWLGPIVKENEYTFTRSNVNTLTRHLLSPGTDLPVHLLSFFGHYGVPVFLFLSAYGLVMKYEGSEPPQRSHRERMSDIMEFMRHHFVKLFKMMIVGFIAFTMVDVITPGTWHYTLGGVVAQLGMVNNLIPHPDKVIWPGPYWFFGLMLQLYAVYRLVLYRRHWGVTVGAMALCMAVQLMCQPESETLNYIRYNFIGGMLPFGAGLLYARHGHMMGNSGNATVAVAAAIMILVFSYDYVMWMTVPLCVCAFSVAFVKLIPRRALDATAWLGSISAALFVCHPVTRKIFIGISKHGELYAGLLLYVMASVALAIVFKRVMDRMR